MNRNLSQRIRIPYQNGNATVEYALVSLALAIALFVETPVGKVLAQAIRTFYSNLTFSMSLP